MSRLRLRFWLLLLASGFLLNATGSIAQDEPESEPTISHEPVEIIEADEPAEVTAGRLAGLPAVASARLIALRLGIAERHEAGASGVHVLNIRHFEEIELGLAYYFERAIDEAEEADAALVIIHMDTPGGRVDAAIRIRDRILTTDIPVVVLVDRRAWSAGALISLATDLIIMAEGSSIGAATVVQSGGGGGMQPVEEKMTSAFRSEMRATAEATSRSPEIAESMVDANLAVGGVIPSGRLTTLTGREAVEFGISETRMDDIDEVMAFFGLEDEPILVVEETWAESVVRILTSSMVAGLLMSLGMLGLFFELMSPGFGWAGGFGLACLTLFFTGHLLVHLAGAEEVLLVVGGIVLLGLEIFVIPGFGIAGLAGVLAIGAGLTMALVASDISIELQPISISGALIRVMTSLSVTLVGMILVFKYLPRTAVGRRLVLAAASATGSSVEHDLDHGIQVGELGIVLSNLAPTGKARIGDRRTEVVSEEGYIEKGTRIRVTRIAGNRVEVRPAPEETEEETT
jgi:membrane-bound serine protease (ClpP class)